MAFAKHHYYIVGGFKSATEFGVSEVLILDFPINFQILFKVWNLGIYNAFTFIGLKGFRMNAHIP